MHKTKIKTKTKNHYIYMCAIEQIKKGKEMKNEP